MEWRGDAGGGEIGVPQPGRDRGRIAGRAAGAMRFEQSERQVADVPIGIVQDHGFGALFGIEQNRIGIEREEIEHAFFGLRVKRTGAIVAQPERGVGGGRTVCPCGQKGVGTHFHSGKFHQDYPVMSQG